MSRDGGVREDCAGYTGFTSEIKLQSGAVSNIKANLWFYYTHQRQTRIGRVVPCLFRGIRENPAMYVYNILCIPHIYWPGFAIGSFVHAGQWERVKGQVLL